MHCGFCGLAGGEAGKETVGERVRTGNFTRRLEGEAGGEVHEAGTKVKRGKRRWERNGRRN